MTKEKQNETLEIKRIMDNKIVSYKAIKQVKKSGNSGAVTIPKELIGKLVNIELIEKENESHNKLNNTRQTK